MTIVPSELKVKRLVLSEITFSNKSIIDSVVKQLRKVRATGKLIVNLSQGGVNSVVFEAKNSIDGHSHIELKFDTPTLP